MNETKTSRPRSLKERIRIKVSELQEESRKEGELAMAHGNWSQVSIIDAQIRVLREMLR